MDKTGRNGLRVGDLLDKSFTTEYIKLRLKHQRLLESLHFQEDVSAWEEEFFEALDFMRQFKIVNGEYFINDKISQGKNVLAEGAQGSMLDVDFGTFPYVTSSNTISAGVCTGLGIAATKDQGSDRCYQGLLYARRQRPFSHRAGQCDGRCPAQSGQRIRGYYRQTPRCGWIDLVALRYACMINGVTKLVMTKADVLDDFDTLDVCTAYNVDGEVVNEVPFQLTRHKLEPVLSSFPGWKKDITAMTAFAELPANMKEYISFIDNSLKVKVSYISNGPARKQLIEHG